MGRTIGNGFKKFEELQRKRRFHRWSMKGRGNMISNQILQNTIEGLKAIGHVEFCVVDAEGKTLAETTPDLRVQSSTALEFAKSPADSQEVAGNQYFKIYDEQQLEYMVIAMGSGENVYMVGKMAAFQIQNLLIAYKERFDKDNFIKNLLLDNLLLVDIYSRAKKLHVQPEARRVTMVIEGRCSKETNLLELMRSNFGTNSKDFITAVDENNVIVVKEIDNSDTNTEIDKTAYTYQALLEKDGVADVRISYGTPVKEIKDII